MGIPDYQSFMLPLLKYASDDKEHTLKETYEELAQEFNLTPEDKNALLPSGTKQIYKNRIGWARTYLSKAGLLESNKRGYLNISKRGKDFLAHNPQNITNKDLEQFPEFLEFKSRKNTTATTNDKTITEETPEEIIENSITELNSNLASELLVYLKDVSPNFFERLVVELLVKMGYGGSRKEAGEVIGKTGDEGIDGIIKEDKLGLDVIYIQAKRWENVISRPEIQKFVGALQGKRAKKGIFLTTSHFSKEAIDYTRMIDNKVILIDGNELANLMIENEIGVTTINTYFVRRIDTDYFLEE
jgi:restriction system protein